MVFQRPAVPARWPYCAAGLITGKPTTERRANRPESPGVGEGGLWGTNTERDREQVLSRPLWPHILDFSLSLDFSSIKVWWLRAGSQLADIFWGWWQKGILCHFCLRERHTHARTHTPRAHTHTRTHTQTHTDTRTHTQTRTNTHKLARIHTRTHTHTHTACLLVSACLNTEM